MRKVIEPSEIIVDQPKITREDVSHVNPWIRFLARFFDYSIIGLVLSFFPSIRSVQFLNIIPLTYLLWIPIEAFLLFTWGYTPGKFLLRSKLSYQRKKLPFYKALRRSFLVWFRGVGMGIPFIQAICMVVAYVHLKNARLTTWDRDEKILITHKAISTKVLFVAVLAMVLFILFQRSDSWF